MQITNVMPQSHLPGDKVLQFLNLLKVFWMFLHVLVIEEGLGKKKKKRSEFKFDLKGKRGSEREYGTI